MLARDEVISAVHFAHRRYARSDAGAPITVFAGMHVGCFELFGTKDIHSIADLKGQHRGCSAPGDRAHMLTSFMAELVGLDPREDIRWVTDPDGQPDGALHRWENRCFLAGPQLRRLRARNIGHVVVNSIADRPWSQYFCCMLAEPARNSSANIRLRPSVCFARLLKAADLCVSDPERVAQLGRSRVSRRRYDYALQALNESAVRRLAGL